MTLNVTVTFPASADASAAVADGLTIRRYELREEMSELFELTVEVLSTDPALAETAFVGQAAVVDFGDEPFVKEIHGIVRRMEQRTAVPAGHSLYVWTIVPPLWLTTRRRDSRIFQNLSVDEIVDAVLLDPTYRGRVPTPAKRLGVHEAREYVVQYDETDWAFLSRILADAGIASFFDHANGSAWTLVDDTTISAPALSGPIVFSDPTHMSPLVDGSPGTPHVLTAIITSNVETSAVTIRDYDFEKPQYVLQAKKGTDTGATSASEPGLEAYGFEVGKFTEQAAGDTRAAALLEADRSTRRRILCTSSFALPPGTQMPLVDHPRDDLAGDFLVVRAHTVMEADTRGTHELELMDLATRFRPALRPKGRIYGNQTAFVVGADGQEIDVDKYGRVEVEFRWDRRDRHTGGTSRRVRVSQGWAGAGFGFVMLPRVNEEVIVAYLDGDPDEPIVVGRVHNAFVTTPLKLPDEKTVSIWKSRSSPAAQGSDEDRYNMVRMEDKAGAELLSLRAQRDCQQDTLHDSSITVGGNESTSVTGSQSTSAGSISMSSGSTMSLSAETTMTEEADKIDIAGRTDVLVTAGTDVQIGAGSYVEVKAPLLLAEGTGLVVVRSDGVIVAQAGATIMVDGGVSVTIHAGAIVKVDAPVVQVEGGTVNVKGGSINLNC
jgi:type VI secretion system secreted protein VgrG